MGIGLSLSGNSPNIYLDDLYIMANRVYRIRHIARPSSLEMMLRYVVSFRCCLTVGLRFCCECELTNDKVPSHHLIIHISDDSPSHSREKEWWERATYVRNTYIFAHSVEDARYQGLFLACEYIDAADYEYYIHTTYSAQFCVYLSSIDTRTI